MLSKTSNNFTTMFFFLLLFCYNANNFQMVRLHKSFLSVIFQIKNLARLILHMNWISFEFLCSTYIIHCWWNQLQKGEGPWNNDEFLLQTCSLLENSKANNKLFYLAKTTDRYCLVNFKRKFQAWKVLKLIIRKCFYWTDALLLLFFYSKIIHWL